jgi:hypothetical protein
LMNLRVSDVAPGAGVQSRAVIVQQKTGRPVQFEITSRTRESLEAWISELRPRGPQYCQSGRGAEMSEVSFRGLQSILVGNLIKEMT